MLSNFSSSISAAQSLDSKLASAGSSISSNYSDLLAITTRQVFGAFDLTIPQSTQEDDIDETTIRAFTKDFGNLSGGGWVKVSLSIFISFIDNESSVNAVDVIYAAMPAYIYLWPELLTHLLRPLLQYQISSAYTNPYAAQGLGLFYP